MSDKKTLFIGWGAVVADYYWKWLCQVFKIHAASSHEHLDEDPAAKEGVVVAELKAKCANKDPRVFMEWGTPALEGLIRGGVFERILVLTPPDRHLDQVSGCLELLKAPASPVPIFVEKPIDSDLEKAKEFLGKHPPETRRFIRSIDHYTQKWTSRFLKDHGATLLPGIGRVTRVVFVSLEERGIWPSPAFGAGYAREHGVHAVAMIRWCLPQLARPGVAVAADHDKVRTWRHADCPRECVGESAFLLHFRVTGLPPAEFADAVEIVVAGGKGMEGDVKKLMVVGEHGCLVSRFNADKMYRCTDEVAEVGKNEEKAEPYQTIVRGIFTGTPDEVTLPIDEAVTHVEMLELAARAFPQPSPHRLHVTPPELAAILRQFPAL